MFVNNVLPSNYSHTISGRFAHLSLNPHQQVVSPSPIWGSGWGDLSKFFFDWLKYCKYKFKLFWTLQFWLHEYKIYLLKPLLPSVNNIQNIVRMVRLELLKVIHIQNKTDIYENIPDLNRSSKRMVIHYNFVCDDEDQCIESYIWYNGKVLCLTFNWCKTKCVSTLFIQLF